MFNWSILTLVITSASVPALLTMLHSADISLKGIQYIDDLQVQVKVLARDYSRVNDIVVKRGDSVHLVDRQGVYFSLKHILQRPLIFLGFLIWAALVIYIPTRVFFIQVEGNRNIDAKQIIEAAEKCGVQFGVSRNVLRSEKVKNALLEEIPDLQWVGINTYGCIAVISINERTTPDITFKDYAVNSVVAARDGIISSVTVNRGNLICTIGQAVRAGQVLISGYTNCGLSLKAERADGEVRAITSRRISAITLSCPNLRLFCREKRVQYSIQIGKNVVKLYKSSRIPNEECVKIYSEENLTLPGNFKLPVTLIREEIYSYDIQPVTSVNSCDFSWLDVSAEEYIACKMVAGHILRSNITSEQSADTFQLYGTYTCEEIIGQIRIEESYEYNGQRSRQNN